MRRTMLMLVGAGLLSMLAGCHCFCAHGVCDCEDLFEDQCIERQPWACHCAPPPMVAPAGAVVFPPPAESIPSPGPTKLPDAKKGL